MNKDGNSISTIYKESMPESIETNMSAENNAIEETSRLNLSGENTSEDNNHGKDNIHGKAPAKNSILRKTLRKILESFGFYNHSRFMESSMTEDNIHAIHLISILAIFAAALFLNVSFTNPGYAAPIYRYTNLAAILISGTVMVIVQLFRKKIQLSFHRFHAFMFFYILWLTFCGVVASVTDSQNRGGFIAFLTSQIWIYDLILIPPFISVILCGINFGIFTIVISHLMYFPPAKYVETAIFYVTIIAVNYFHYRSALIKINREEVMLNDNVRLDKLSTTDELTDVRNRTGLRVDFNHRFSDNLFVMMCDIDNFKHYNDTYGHETGDKVLSMFALILSETFGRANVYRYGGDEFLVLVTMDDERQFLERVQQAAWAYSNTAFKNNINPTNSSGYVYGSCHNSDELRAMIQAADTQLYEAKKAGRNQIRGSKMQEM